MYTWQGPWTRASGSNPAFSGQTGTLSLATHVLFAFATDGQDAGINGGAFNGQVTIGEIAAYPFAVMQASTATALTADVNPSVAGGMVTLTATVIAIAPGTGTPTGTVTFFDGTTALGTGSLNSSGVATLATSALTAGTHSLTAKYNGSTNFAGSISAAVMETITPAAATATTTVLVSSAASASSGASVTFTATIKSSTSGTPTGTLTFLDGATTLGTGTLNGSGVATFTTSTLGVGTHSITAAYGGDSNFAASTSTVMSQVVLAPSFGLSGSPSSSTVSAGNPASYQIMVTGKNNFSSAVALSCSAGLPTGASCAFSPDSVTPGTAPETSTLMISTQPHTTALLLPFSGGRRAPVFAAWLLVPAMVFGFLGLAQLSQLRAVFGIFAIIFVVKSCISIAEL